MAKEKEFEYEYNPIKDKIGGEAAEKVVWSGKSLEMAVEGIRKGLPLKSNPFIGKNTQLLKPELVRKYSKEEYDDYLKCATDPIYFASKCYLMTPEGLQQCVLRDYQIDYLKHLQNNRFSIFLSCRQSGKCNCLIINQLCKIHKNYLDNRFAGILKKYYFYIEDNYIYIILPLFELYNLVCDKTFNWKIKYYLYKLIYNIDIWQELKDKKLENLKKIVKNFQSTIKRIFQSGQNNNV